MKLLFTIFGTLTISVTSYAAEFRCYSYMDGRKISFYTFLDAQSSIGKTTEEKTYYPLGAKGDDIKFTKVRTTLLDAKLLEETVDSCKDGRSQTYKRAMFGGKIQIDADHNIFSSGNDVPISKLLKWSICEELTIVSCK